MITVEREDKLFTVSAEMMIDAPRDVVFAALSDYDQFSELSDAFVESRFVEPAPDGTPRIYTAVEGCIWFFCKTIRRYSRLELMPDEKIVATVEPELSDAEYAREQWLLESEGDATRVYYRHDLQPDFWVPPGIGTWAIKRVLSDSSVKAASRIEALARQKQAAKNMAEAEAALE